MYYVSTYIHGSDLQAAYFLLCRINCGCSYSIWSYLTWHMIQSFLVVPSVLKRGMKSLAQSEISNTDYWENAHALKIFHVMRYGRTRIDTNLSGIFTDRPTRFPCHVQCARYIATQQNRTAEYNYKARKFAVTREFFKAVSAWRQMLQMTYI